MANERATWESTSAALAADVLNSDGTSIQADYTAAQEAYNNLVVAGLETAYDITDWATLKGQAIAVVPALQPAAATPLVSAAGIGLGSFTVPWVGVALIAVAALFAAHQAHKARR